MSLTEGGDGKPKEKKSNAGRPTLYNSESHPERAYKLSLLGLTDMEMAEVLDVAESTFKLWLTVHPEFSASYKKGKTDADAEVVKSLYDKAMSGDATAQIFWLKNRRNANWRDRKEVDLNANVRHSVEEFTDEDLAAIAKRGSNGTSETAKGSKKSH